MSNTVCAYTTTGGSIVGIFSSVTGFAKSASALSQIYDKQRRVLMSSLYLTLCRTYNYFAIFKMFSNNTFKYSSNSVKNTASVSRVLYSKNHIYQSRKSTIQQSRRTEKRTKQIVLTHQKKVLKSITLLPTRRYTIGIERQKAIADLKAVSAAIDFLEHPNGFQKSFKFASLYSCVFTHSHSMKIQTRCEFIKEVGCEYNTCDDILLWHHLMTAPVSKIILNHRAPSLIDQNGFMSNALFIERHYVHKLLPWNMCYGLVE
ncbi:hypothetical protein L9F63_021287, partial [Diploptera punctata]